jgi:hypothetical protein
MAAASGSGSCRQHLVLRAAYLRLHNLELSTDEQQQLSAELMRPQLALRLSAVLLHNEEFAKVHRGTVPIGSLKDVHGPKCSTRRIGFLAVGLKA